MSPTALAGIIFAALLLLLASGLPIAFSLGFISVIGMLVLQPQTLNSVALTVYHYGTAWTLICLPLFIFMAEVLVYSGVATDAYEAAYKWLGRLPGGLAVASVVGCGVFSAVSGSSTGTAAAIGIASVPEMLKRGYSRRLATGATAAGGTLGILIPPSAIMIIYGAMTQTSIGKLFMAGWIPGIMLVILFSLYIIIHARINPAIAPPMSGFSWKEKLDSLSGIWPVVVIIVLLMGGLYTGVATPTEIAALGAFASVVVALIYRRFTWANLRDGFLRTVRVTCFVFFIIFGAMMFGNLLTLLKIPQAISADVAALQVSPMVIIIIINLLLIFLGCFIDPAGMLVITLPVFFPLIMNLGFDPVWFGIVMTINMEMGNLTPPVGLNLFVIKAISPPEVTLADVTRGALPFVVVQAIGLALVIAIPQISLWLPSMMWK